MAATNAAATPPSPKLAPGIATSNGALKNIAAKQGATPRVLGNKPQSGEPGSSSGLPAGVPSKGNYAFLLALNTQSTTTAQAQAKSRGTTAARAAAKAQLSTVTTAQNRVIAALPSKSRVLYRTHAVMAGIAVVTDVKNYAALKGLTGVSAVYPIAPKSISNSYAVPLQAAPQAWEAYGDRGKNSTVAIIDTGIDYTHADFGGAGTVADYQAAKAQLGQPVSPNEFPGPKVIGGFDLAGDDYQADPNSPDYNPVPSPDPYPLDCNSHGSHVAGTVAGYGENADGSTYTGAYDTSTPFSSMRIGPGMAPEAKLYAYRVFGCEGSTDLVSDAIDMAADPNGDGDTSDHVDVINMSLGSDYGSPQDGDSVTTEAASALGITMVIASGNGGDLYDVGGSPGDAPSSIAVAASVDAYAQVDALNITAPAAIAGPQGAERSIAYDYTTGPDLSGDVARVTDPTNLDGCKPLNAADTAAVAGKIAFVEWTDVDANRACGSAARGANIAAAGATGFIYADDEDNFSAGITGVASIPGVLVTKTGGDLIRTQLLAGNTVTIGSTTVNGFAQLDPTLNDTVAGFSSRGIGDADNVKPDVTAVGASVFSAGNGTGNEGLNDSGTSMATPMVAGTAALVRSLHPDWTPEQTKADIMNTADQDLFTDLNHTGDKFAPERVGSGRIDVKKALDNSVLAYNATNHGSVSLSFGQLEVTAPKTLTKTIKVQNTGLTAASYDVTYDARTSIPGAVYSVSPSTVTVDPRSSVTVTVTLTIDPSALTKTIDPTVDREQGGLPREYEADASGLVVLTGDGVPNLRVPVYAAPRPASVMTQAASLTLPSTGVQSALLPLTGTQVHQGSGAAAIQSIVSGFELQATSPAIANCTATVTSGCIAFPDEKSSDLKYVGVTSNAPQVTSIGGDPAGPNGLTYFAVSTQGPWRTPAGLQEFDILIDVDGDGVPDAVLFNTRLTGSDVMVAELVDLNTGDVLDAEPINDRFGDTDTALLNSDTLVMPVATGALGGTRFTYGVDAFSAYQSDPFDSVGFDSDGDVSGALSFDPLHPGVAVYGSYNGDASALLYADSPGSVLAIRRDGTAYGLDHGLGALIVHFQNAVGSKAQVLKLPTAPGAPTGVHGTAGNTKVALSWKAPANNGGSAITGYDVQYSSNAGSTWKAGPHVTSTSATVTGLTNGTSYVFHVRAVNASGAGPYSANSAAVKPVKDASSLTIGKSTSIKKGKSLVIATVLTDTTTKHALAGAHVTLYKRADAKHAWTGVIGRTTSSTGAASISMGPTSTMQFQWVYAGDATHNAVSSAVQTVTVTK